MWRFPLTKPTDTAESTSETHCMVLRRLKDGSYSAEFNRLVEGWRDWHYYPINVEHYATVFKSPKAAKKYIKEQQKEWPNFEYKVIDLDS